MSDQTAHTVVKQAVDHDPRNSALGKILVRLGVVDVVDVLLAAYEQDLGDRRRIGAILVDKGLATAEDIEFALRGQLGEAAMDASAATDVVPEPAPDFDVSEFPRAQGGVLRAFQAVVLLALLGAAGFVLTSTHGGPVFGVAAYGLLSLPYLLAKLFLSLRYRAVREPMPADTAVSVVVPFLNEDPVTFERCLNAILNQSLPPAEVFIIDDGSKTRAAFEVARHFAARHSNVKVCRLPENRGKRAAQDWGFSRATSPFVATVDSDTVLHPDALAEAVKPLADPKVNGVCGYARGLNRRRNILTRLIDLRYTNSFLYERAAYSVLGSVLCSTGVLSVWRRELLEANREDYQQQTFLGNEVHYGDDRRLTAYGLRTGKVVLQDTAIALTALPESMSQFMRQQVRWNKSFFRESMLLLKEMRPTRIAWWLGAAEFVYWMVLTTMLFYAVAVRPILHSQPPTWHYAAFIAIMAYARSIRMIGDRGRLLPVAFLLAPLYGVLNLVLLVPLRFYSLVRLRDGRWGTRRRRRGLRRGDSPDAALPGLDVESGPVEMAPLPSAAAPSTAGTLASLLPRPRREASEQDLASTAAVLTAAAAAEEEAPLVHTTAVFSPPTGVRCVDIVPAQQERRGKARD
jgi:hyaluronan synthase